MVAFSDETLKKCRACRAVKSDLSQSGWQERYDAGKTGWERGDANPALTTWLDAGRLQPCRIQIPGCGRGYEASCFRCSCRVDKTTRRHSHVN